MPLPPRPLLTPLPRAISLYPPLASSRPSPEFTSPPKSSTFFKVQFFRKVGVQLLPLILTQVKAVKPVEDTPREPLLQWLPGAPLQHLWKESLRLPEAPFHYLHLLHKLPECDSSSVLATSVVQKNHLRKEMQFKGKEANKMQPCHLPLCKRHLGNIDCSQALRRPTWSTTQICSQSGSWGPASIYQTKCLKYLETWYLQILNTSKHSFIQFYRATPPCLTIFTSFHYYTIILVCLFEKSNFIGIPEHVVTFFLIQFSEQRHHVWQDCKLSLFFQHISLFVWKVQFHCDNGTC